MDAFPAITRADESDIVTLALKYDFDYVCASQTFKSKDLKAIRDVLGPRGSNTNVLVKVDTMDGLHNFKDLVQNSDGAIFCREELNAEIPSEKLVYAQKWVCEVANHYGKPVFIHG